MPYILMRTVNPRLQRILGRTGAVYPGSIKPGLEVHIINICASRSRCSSDGALKASAAVAMGFQEVTFGKT